VKFNNRTAKISRGSGTNIWDKYFKDPAVCLSSEDKRRRRKRRRRKEKDEEEEEEK